MNTSKKEVTEELEKLIHEKSEALNAANIAVNDFVALKNEYVMKSNDLRINTDFKEAMNLSKPATEKQQQAYIEDKLQDLVQNIRIAEENVKSWKREVDLLNDKISLEKYRVNLWMGAVYGNNKS